MTGRQGRQQSTFTAGELSPLLDRRTELKYVAAGLRRAANVEIYPQGGFRARRGTRRVAPVAATSIRQETFVASTGVVYDLVFTSTTIVILDAAGATVASLAHPFSVAQIQTLDYVQQLDTALMFHEDVAPRRLRVTPSGWSIDQAPLTNVPSWDYGAVYTNGRPAIWEIEFIGLTEGTPAAEKIAFKLTVSGVDTNAANVPVSSPNVPNAAAMATLIRTMLETTNVVDPGIVVTVLSNYRFQIRFEGTGNQGDGWAVSGTIINKADAAIVAYKTQTGVTPGEPIVSAARGWPRCAAFYQQRLIVGGFKGLPNGWMASVVGDYFNFDTTLAEANGAFVVPMDTGGGEIIRRIFAGRNLFIFTSAGEYWIADRNLSKTTPPVHVQASEAGIAAGTPVVRNEGANLFVDERRANLVEYRYTDVDGNYSTLSLSILAPHLVQQVIDQAVRKSEGATSAAILAYVQTDGAARLCFLLRDQDVTAFTRLETPGLVKSVRVNGRNELRMIVQRGANRAIEELDDEALLDGEIRQSFAPATAAIGGLLVYNGLTVWAVADGDVFGPYLVAGGAITLPRPASDVRVGLWTPPIAASLPLPREVGPRIVLQRPARIHSLQLHLEDTTSLAVAVNDGPARDVPLRRTSDVGDRPELSSGYSGLLTLRGLVGFDQDPRITVTQTRPGRLTVKAWTIEAQL